MWEVSADQLRAILGNAEAHTICNVLAPIAEGSNTYKNVATNIFTTGGSTTASMGNHVGRAAAFSVDQSYIDAGLFNPLTDKVYLRLLMTGFPDIPLFFGRTEEITSAANGSSIIRCVGPADDVVNHELMSPWAANADGMVSDELKNIISDVDITYTIDTTLIAGIDRLVGVTQVWEDDRVKAIQDLTNGINAIWQENRVGTFIAYPNPYVSPESQQPVITLHDTNGVLVDVQNTKSRANIFNSITVIVERTDLTDPIRVTVFDNNPNSNTRYGGPFGKRNKNVKIQSPLDIDEALDLAVRLLRQYIALSDTWTITVPFLPIIDHGDVFNLWYKNVIYTLVAESVDFDLGLTRGTKIVGRRLHFIDPSTIGSM